MAYRTRRSMALTPTITKAFPVQRYFMKTQIPPFLPAVASGLLSACSMSCLLGGSWAKSASAIWAGSAAVVMGIPSIDVEAGGSGVVDAKAVEMLTEGFERILSDLGMIAKQFPAPTDQLTIFDR